MRIQAISLFFFMGILLRRPSIWVLGRAVGRWTSNLNCPNSIYIIFKQQQSLLRIATKGSWNDTILSIRRWPCCRSIFYSRVPLCRSNARSWSSHLEISLPCNNRPSRGEGNTGKGRNCMQSFSVLDPIWKL